MPHAERLGDAVGGDVVMRRADAAGGEDVGVSRAQRIYSASTIAASSSETTRTSLQVDAERGQVIGDVADVLVLGAARQDFVADDKHRRGDDLGASAWRLTYPSSVWPNT